MFNVRVYGILINEQREVLVSDELFRGNYITKFPGGGLEFGEGTRDCLKREFQEELDLLIEVDRHIYTTDFFQPSAFNPEHQIISIYYSVRALEPFKIELGTKPFDFNEEQMKLYKKKSEIEKPRFIPLKEFSAELLSLPIDKRVADIIVAQ